MIDPQTTDIGRRVIYAPKNDNPADRMYGTLVKLWDGIPYIKFDWQPTNAPPIPEHPSLLSWDDEEMAQGQAHMNQYEEAYTQLAKDNPDDDEGILASESSFWADLVTSMAQAAAMALADDSTAPTEETSVSGDGGDFGGGGSSADWGDSRSSPEESADD